MRHRGFALEYRASTGAYVLSMLREAIWQDMALARRVMHVDPAGPTLNLYPDGASYHLGDDMAEKIAATKHFSPAGARTLPKLEEDKAEMAQQVLPVFEWTAPGPRVRNLDALRGQALLGGVGLRARKHLSQLARLFTTTAHGILAEHLESEHVRAALGWHVIKDSVAGPSTPGTAFVLLHDHASEESDGELRQWDFVRGGMGVLTSIMADVAREAGAEIPLLF